MRFLTEGLFGLGVLRGLGFERFLGMVRLLAQAAANVGPFDDDAIRELPRVDSSNV